MNCVRYTFVYNTHQPNFGEKYGKNYFYGKCKPPQKHHFINQIFFFNVHVFIMF